MLTTENLRDRWFVKNVGAETPIFGAFFKEKELSKAVKGSLKSACMLAGGVSFMVTDPFNAMMMGESPVISSAKMAGGMALGMMTGTVAYNILESVGQSIYNCAVSFYSQEGPYRDMNLEM